MNSDSFFLAIGVTFAAACGSTVQSRGDAATSSDALSGAGATTVLASVDGPSTLVDFFPVGDALVIVTSDGIDMRLRDGTSMTIASSRGITAAALPDLTTLVVADRGYVTTYNLVAPDGSPVLRAEQMLPTPDACVSGDFVAPWFICAPETSGAPFVVFDFTAGTVNRSQSRPAGQAIALRAWGPGILTTESGAPPRFGLYAEDDSSGSSLAIIAINYSPTADIPVSRTFVVHSGAELIDEAGDVLELAGTCSANVPVTPRRSASCLQPTGNLGTLAPNEYFLAMADDAMGSVYGLVTTRGSTGCSSGCSAEKIEIDYATPANTIVQRSTYTADVGTTVGAKYDVFTHRMVFGYNRSRGPGNTSRGFQIDAIVP